MNAAAAGATRARLFVALDLPAPARETLARWRGKAAGDDPALRATAPDALHVTLCFLGWRSTEEIEAIAAACAAALADATSCQLSLGEGLWLPQRRPRVLAMALKDRTAALVAIQTALSEALSAGGWYAPEDRPFLPHVTVARVRGRGHVRPSPLPETPQLSFSAQTVTLYRSRPGAGGARYEALRTIALGQGGGAADDPVEIVRAFHVAQRDAYAGGALEPLRGWLTEDVVWHVPGRSQIAGEHRGVEAVLAYFDTRRRLTDETFRVNVRGLAVIGERVVQLAGGAAMRDRRHVSWETVGVFRVKNGRIAECWLLPFDQYSFDEIWD